MECRDRCLGDCVGDSREGRYVQVFAFYPFFWARAEDGGKRAFASGRIPYEAFSDNPGIDIREYPT